MKLRPCVRKSLNPHAPWDLDGERMYFGVRPVCVRESGLAPLSISRGAARTLD